MREPSIIWLSPAHNACVIRSRLWYSLFMSNGIAQVTQVGKYSISETDTKRDVDHRRFSVAKAGARKPYIVSWQTRTGRKAACSCPAGVNQKHCKHVDMVASIYN